MRLPKLARTAGLALILSIPCLSVFAAPPPPKACGCNYCSHTSSNTACVFNGTTTTCGEFLAVTLCQPLG